jgi:hypothetical protein
LAKTRDFVLRISKAGPSVEPESLPRRILVRDGALFEVLYARLPVLDRLPLELADLDAVGSEGWD